MTSLADLTRGPHWLLWKLVAAADGGKAKKLPFYADGSPRRGQLDSDADRSRLVAFETAQHAARGFNGQDFAVGLAVSPPLVFVDLDGCLDSGRGFCGTPEQREIFDAARAAGALICVSQSGRGLHIFGVCSERITRKDAGVEIYTGARFCAWTGDVWQAGDAEGLPDLTDLARRHSRPAATPAAPGEIPAGQRHNTFLRMAGRLHRAGLDAEAMTAALRSTNARQRTPLPDAELVRIARDIAAKPRDEAESAPIAYNSIAVPTLADIESQPIAPRTWFYPDLIPAGAFLIVGRPKIGKSWLLLQLALAGARQQSFLGYQSVEHHHD